MSDSPAKTELLAPAGTLATFAAAVQAGADAVYIGTPHLNARNLARHFSQTEIAAMIDHGHGNGVRVYLAMNSLMKEEEIPQVVELLALLEQLSPDALIIQDIGLCRLIRKYFPALKIHASTLLGAHNSLAVHQFSKMGFSRVVLAREMTLTEIKKIHAADQLELEVFVHGALCFSYSGLCLFSSYYGGKSGLRGRCVQPCRRRYTWTGPGKGYRSGYLFSMNDLDALELVPQIVRAGVVSLKIEGRMRSSRYVSSVVRAYRLILDQGVSRETVRTARELLGQAMGRKGSSGYFLNDQPDELISAHHSGNIGLFLGKLTQVKGGWGTLKLKESLQCGDRLRLHHENSGERQSLTLKKVNVQGKSRQSAEPGETIMIELHDLSPRPGDTLYKVDVNSPRHGKERKNNINPAHYNKKINKLSNGRKAGKIIQQLGLSQQKIQPRQKFRPGKKKFHGRKNTNKLMPLWLKTTDPALIAQLAAYKPDKIILNLAPDNFNRFQKLKKNRVWPRLLVWGLPPVILEDEIPFYQKAISRLLNEGYRNWQISHLSQLQFFPDSRRVNISGEYTLNVLNSQALALLKEAGLKHAVAGVENDRNNIKMICAHKQGMKVGMMVYGLIPLFTSRLDTKHFQYGRIVVSPKGEKFVLRRQENLTIALPLLPFSLLSRLSEVTAAGVDYGVVDFSFQRLRKRELDSIFRQINGRSAKTKKLSTFNFFGNLS